MRLAHPIIAEPITFSENNIPVWIIERKQQFITQIAELQWRLAGNEGSYVLSQNFKPLSIAKHVHLVTDYFNLELNQRKVLTAIYRDLQEIAHGAELSPATIILWQQLTTYMEEMIADYDIPLIYGEQLDIINLCKMVDLKVIEDTESLLEQLLSYLTLIHRVLKPSLFVLVNLKMILPDSDLEALYRQLGYQKIKIMLLESQCSAKRLKSEKWRILDQDLCEI